MKNDFITRNFVANNFTAKNENNITGHAAIFQERTSIAGLFYEVIEPGAFDQADLSDVMLLVNHNIRNIPLARCRANNATMSINIDSKGLCVDAKLDIENNLEAKAVYSAVKRGDLDGMSFGFWIKEEKWENLNTDMPTRRILKIKKVSEVSIVNKPAYSGTDIAARSEGGEDAKNVLKEVRSSKKNINNKLEIEKLKIAIQYKYNKN